MQHVAAEPPDRLRGGARHRAQKLRIRIHDNALLIGDEDPLDDAGQHRLCLSFAAAQRGCQLDEILAHLIHRAGKHPKLPWHHMGNGAAEIPEADAVRHVRQAHHGRG